MKFQVYQSYWGMSSLPFGGEEWSMAAKLAKIAEAGFDGVEWLMEENSAAWNPSCNWVWDWASSRVARWHAKLHHRCTTWRSTSTSILARGSDRCKT
jgi:hypothetical protein